MSKFGNIILNNEHYPELVAMTNVGNSGIQLNTGSGYLQFGPLNTSHCHFQTDRGNFYFNKGISVNTGLIDSYDEDLQLRRAGSTTARLRITAGTTTSDQPLSVTGAITATGGTLTGDLTMGNNVIYGDLSTTALRVGSQGYFASVRNIEIRADDDDSSDTEYLLLSAGQNKLKITSTSSAGTDNNKLTYNGNKVWNAGNDGSGSGLDADTVDGIQGSNFLRSDTSDTMSGQLSVSGNIAINGSFGTAYPLAVSSSQRYIIGMRNTSADANYPWFFHETNSSMSALGVHFNAVGDKFLFREDGNAYFNGGLVWHNGNDGSGSGLDADLLDGQHGSYYYSAGNPPPTYAKYLRSDANDTATGRINFNANATNNWDTIATTGAYQGSLEVYNSGSGNDAFMAFHTGSDYALYFGLDADTNKLSVGGWSMGAVKYAIWHEGNDGSGSGLDADTVDGIQASSFMRSDADDSFSGGLVSTSRDEGIFGSYDSTKTDHIWSMGTSYKNHSAGTNFGNLYGLAYKHTNNSTGGTMGGSHQMVWCNNGTPRAAIGYDRFWHAASGNLWGSSNDGSGSGLDADTCDGQHLGSSAAVQFGAVSHRGFTSSSVTAKIMGSGDSAAKLYWRKNDTNTLMTLDMSGNLTATGNVTAYSDRRIKENITPITEALSKVQRLTGNTYTRNDQEDTATKYAGLIAQEVEDVLPEAVREVDDGIKALDYNATIALLVESIKELKAEVDDLKSQLENK